MLKLYVPIGQSGCGKSTWAMSVAEKEGARIVSTDVIRGELWGNESIQKSPSKVFNVAYNRLNEFLSEGYSCVFDATNIRKKDRKKIVEIGKQNNATIVFLWFETSLEDSIANQKKRERKVPENAIKNQFYLKEFPSKDEGWNALFLI